MTFELSIANDTYEVTQTIEMGRYTKSVVLVALKRPSTVSEARQFYASADTFDLALDALHNQMLLHYVNKCGVF